MTGKNEPTVVIDTNLFISAIIRGGTPYKLLEAWKQNKFSIVITRNLFEELTEVLKREEIFTKYSLNQTEIQKLLDGLELNAIFVAPLEVSDLSIHSRDPKDDKLLTCVLAGDISYLVTGDEDLLVLSQNAALGNLKIITVKEFLNQLHFL
ncbi:putative toxin-antitoxin system toxin component, PIN family [Candidatus Curtissbacteria bacterium]|nr:putative toxin-antitoxin system toxin component, PIN family [Candidatus Curtissbacteria bacterium]